MQVTVRVSRADFSLQRVFRTLQEAGSGLGCQVRSRKSGEGVERWGQSASSQAVLSTGKERQKEELG